MIRAKTPASDFIVNLDGPNGNAYYLLSLAKEMAHHKGQKASPILNEMQSKDYNNLVVVFDKHFGDQIILETTNEDLLSKMSWLNLGPYVMIDMSTFKEYFNKYLLKNIKKVTSGGLTLGPRYGRTVV